MSNWLVRTQKNQISGPFSKEEVSNLVMSGELGFQDEICEGNSYWIYLHEQEEVLKLLGVTPPGPDEENTETETDTKTDWKGAEGDKLNAFKNRESVSLVSNIYSQKIRSEFIGRTTPSIIAPSNIIAPINNEKNTVKDSLFWGIIEPVLFWRIFTTALILLVFWIIFSVLRLIALGVN